MNTTSKKNKVYFGQDESKTSNENENKHGASTRNYDGENSRNRNDDAQNQDGVFSVQSIYALLKQAGHPLRLDDILRRAEVTRRSKKEILSLLQDLIDMGKVIRQRGAAYAISESLKNIQGRVAVQRSGAAFVTPQKENGDNGVGGKSTGEDIYIPAHELGDAWNGDLVEVLILPSARPNFKGTPQKREGRISQVIERGQSEFTVRLEHYAPKPYFKFIEPFAQQGFIALPTDSRFNFRILVPAQAMPVSETSQDPNLHEGDLIIIKIGDRLPSRGDNPLWFGTPIKKLGAQDRVSVQEEITKLGHGIPTHFPDDVLAESKEIAEAEGFYYTDNDAKGLKNEVKVSLDEHDVDLRNMHLVTIDGADSKDFDDAIFVEKQGDNWRLVVAIADVSRYVLPFSKLDNEARQRGNSYYFPSSVEPMLPESLSNGLCSLRPNEDHRVMFADMLFNDKGIRQKSSFGQGIMRSKARLTYDAVQELYDKGIAKDAPFAENMDEDVNKMLIEAKKLSLFLIERRRKAGSLHLEIPEPKCVTKDDEIVELATRPHFFAHELIEAFMVSANEAVAEFLAGKDAPCLYRVHPAPTPERLESLNVALQTTAISEFLPTQTPEKMGANHWLSQLLYSLEENVAKASTAANTEKETEIDIEQNPRKKSPKNKEENPAETLAKNTYLAHRLILRSMMQARYTPYLEEHFGLASECYCHFTSPIRRYADLMVHRSLKESLGITKKQTKIFDDDSLVSTADMCNERERIAQAAEREIFRRLACLLLEGEEGKEFDAVVSGLSNFGLFAEMSVNMAEGMIRMENLGNDYFIYDEEAQTLYGQQSGTVYRLGDSIKVTLTSVDLSRLEINLGLVGALPRAKRGDFRPRGRTDAPRAPEKGPRAQQDGKGPRAQQDGKGARDKKPYGRKPGKKESPLDKLRGSSKNVRSVGTTPPPRKKPRSEDQAAETRDNWDNNNSGRTNQSDTGFREKAKANKEKNKKIQQKKDDTNNKVHSPKRPKQRDLAKDPNHPSSENKRKKKQDHKKKFED